MAAALRGGGSGRSAGTDPPAAPAARTLKHPQLARTAGPGGQSARAAPTTRWGSGGGGEVSRAVPSYSVRGGLYQGEGVRGCAGTAGIASQD